MRWVSEVVEQNLDASIWKRFPDETHQPHVVLEILICVVGDLFAIVFLKQLRIDLLFRRLQLRPHITLLANENELPRGRMVFVLEEVMHAQPEILWAELPKILASDREWIEIVLFEISPELATPFFVFSPGKSCR